MSAEQVILAVMLALVATTSAVVILITNLTRDEVRDLADEVDGLADEINVMKDTVEAHAFALPGPRDVADVTAQDPETAREGGWMPLARDFGTPEPPDYSDYALARNEMIAHQPGPSAVQDDDYEPPPDPAEQDLGPPEQDAQAFFWNPASRTVHRLPACHLAEGDRHPAFYEGAMDQALEKARRSKLRECGHCRPFGGWLVSAATDHWSDGSPVDPSELAAQVDTP